MTKFSEEVSAGGYSLELADCVTRAILTAQTPFLGGSGQHEPFARTSGDDWVGDVGPAMSWQVHEEYEEQRYGTPERGLVVRFVREYYTSGRDDRDDRDDRGDETRIDAYGCAAGELILVRVRSSVYVRWQLPDDEHDELFEAWTAFKTARGLRDGWPGTVERV